jgi:hypothetical protein
MTHDGSPAGAKRGGGLSGKHARLVHRVGALPLFLYDKTTSHAVCCSISTQMASFRLLFGQVRHGRFFVQYMQSKPLITLAPG